MNNIEQVQNDIVRLKQYNTNCEERISDLNYVLGNLKLEYPSLLIYQNANMYINPNFDFSKSFVTKEEVEELITLLKELSRTVVDNESAIKDVNEIIQRG